MSENSYCYSYKDTKKYFYRCFKLLFNYMDTVAIRNYILNIELNSEYEDLRKEVDVSTFKWFFNTIVNLQKFQYLVRTGFQELLGPYKRLHISNIPFIFRESDLIALFKVSKFSKLSIDER